LSQVGLVYAVDGEMIISFDDYCTKPWAISVIYSELTGTKFADKNIILCYRHSVI